MVIPDWDTFTRDIQEIYDLVKKIKKGENAGYIPELAEVNPDYFGISICTIDGQIMEIGDTKVPFSAQSCSKPITYCIAV
jgi:glutaminase